MSTSLNAQIVRLLQTK